MPGLSDFSCVGIQAADFRATDLNQMLSLLLNILYDDVYITYPLRTGFLLYKTEILTPNSRVIQDEMGYNVRKSPP